MLDISIYVDKRCPELANVKIHDPIEGGYIAVGTVDKQGRKELVADLEQAIQELSYDFDEAVKAREEAEIEYYGYHPQ